MYARQPYCILENNLIVYTRLGVFWGKFKMYTRHFQAKFDKYIFRKNLIKYTRHSLVAFSGKI